MENAVTPKVQLLQLQEIMLTQKEMVVEVMKLR